VPFLVPPPARPIQAGPADRFLAQKAARAGTCVHPAPLTLLQVPQRQCARAAQPLASTATGIFAATSVAAGARSIQQSPHRSTFRTASLASATAQLHQHSSTSARLQQPHSTSSTACTLHQHFCTSTMQSHRRSCPHATHILSQTSRPPAPVAWHRARHRPQVPHSLAHPHSFAPMLPTLPQIAPSHATSVRRSASAAMAAVAAPRTAFFPRCITPPHSSIATQRLAAEAALTPRAGLSNGYPPRFFHRCRAASFPIRRRRAPAIAVVRQRLGRRRYARSLRQR
jgi:hypothetical protein